MGSLIGWFMLKGLGERGARVAAYASIIAAIVAAAVIGKVLYDRSVIAKHEAKQEAATAKADRKADNHAAEQRGIDQERRATEAAQVKEAIDEARRTGADPRAAYYECVRRQQAARKLGKPSPGCRPPLPG